MQRAIFAFTILTFMANPAMADFRPASSAPLQNPSAAQYRALVSKLQRGETDIDYTLLRLSYVQTADYDPHDSDVRGAFSTALIASKAGDCKTVLDKTAIVLAADFTVIDAHLMRETCFDKTGDKSSAVQEHAIALGLGRSVMKSGDGKSEDTAFVVVTQNEEGFALAMLGRHETMQSLVTGKNHSYDLLDAKDDTTGDVISVYFQIDAIFAGEMKLFAPKKP